MNSTAAAGIRAATTAADQYGDAMARHKAEIEVRPEERITRAIQGFQETLKKQIDRRIEMEADHRTKLDQLRAFYGAEKQELADSMNRLEEQLRLLRERWAKVCEDESVAREEEKQRWIGSDAAQRKLIRASEVMIQELRTP